MIARLGNRRAHLFGDIIALCALTAISILVVLPFAWMVSTSLKTTAEMVAFPPRFIPKDVQWSNYKDAWNALPFRTFFMNSAIVAVVTTIGATLTSSMGGYSFARLRFPGRDRIFLAYLATMMIPFPVLMIPLFVISRRFGLIDNLWGLILPAIFTAWGTFLVRQFILTLPRDLEDAARIDGASYFRIYRDIILPLSRPVVATLAIFTFLSAWNDFLWPLLMISSTDNKTLPLGLAMFNSRAAIRTPWNLIMAASTFSVIPVLIIFILGQRYYVRGIALSGLKG
jgi:multiple sugar transport system permease protein